MGVGRAKDMMIAIMALRSWREEKTRSGSVWEGVGVQVDDGLAVAMVCSKCYTALEGEIGVCGQQSTGMG